MTTLEFIRIPPGKLFSVILRGCYSLFIPLGVVIAVLVVLELMPVYFNDTPTYGVTGFFIALLIYGLLMPLAVTVAFWALLLPGFWLYRQYSRVKETLQMKRKRMSV